MVNIRYLLKTLFVDDAVVATDKSLSRFCQFTIIRKVIAYNHVILPQNRKPMGTWAVKY